MMRWDLIGTFFAGELLGIALGVVGHHVTALIVQGVTVGLILWTLQQQKQKDDQTEEDGGGSE